MKHKLLISMIMLLFSLGASAQRHATRDANGKVLTTYYMEIAGNKSPVAKTFDITLDIGNMLTTRTGLTETELKRAVTSLKFKSMTDAMNLLTQYGWKLVDTYTFSTASMISVRWVVCKEVSDPAELLKGLTSKD